MVLARMITVVLLPIVVPHYPDYHRSPRRLKYLIYSSSDERLR